MADFKRLLHLGFLLPLFIDKLIEAQGACQPPEITSCKACDEESRFGRVYLKTQEHKCFLEGETPHGAKRQGGSPHAPRKASTWSGNQPHPRATMTTASNKKTALFSGLSITV
jgi:hypothetical protein